MKNKKGFTLVEILAVIVILAIILAIAVPRIMVSIDESSKKAFTSDVDQFVGIAKLEYNEKLQSEKEYIYYYFENGEQKSFEGDIHFKGETPKSGYIYIEEGKVELELVSHDEKWCASKKLEDKKAVIDKCSVKDKEPFELTLSTTYSTQSIQVNVQNPETDNIDTYYYDIYELSEDKETKIRKTVRKEKDKEANANINKYTKLDKNKKYRIKVKACRNKNTVCDEKQIDVQLPNIDIPNIEQTSYSPINSSGYARTRTITITYPDVNLTDNNGSNQYQGELVNQYISASSISELNTKASNEENWNICSGSSCKLTYSSNRYIIARITDGYNVILSAQITLTKFDNTKPTTPKITGGSSSWTNGSRTISVTTKSTARSGIKYYQYYKSTSSTTLTGGSWTTLSSTATSKLFNTSGRTYYVFFRGVSNVGLVSDKSNYQIVKIDKTPPSCGTWEGESTTWTNEDRTITVGCTDSQSGCTATSYTVKSYTSGAVQTEDLSYTIKDKVGNTNTCTKTADIYVDKFAPGVPTSTVRYDSASGEVRGNSSAWTNRTLWWGNFSATDTGSGINHYEYSSGCTGSVSGTLSSSYTYDSTRNSNFCIRTVDNVGNPSNWSSAYYFKIDKTRPTCNSSGGSDAWTNDSRTLFGTCYDGESGCQGHVSWLINWEGNWTGLSPGTVYDNVGNSTPCPGNQTVRIDKTLPTISYNLTGGMAYSTTQTVRVTASDANLSKIDVHVYKNGVFQGDKSVTGKPSNIHDVTLTPGRWIIYSRAWDHAGNKQNQAPDNGGGWYYQEYIIGQPNVYYRAWVMTVGFSPVVGNANAYGSNGQTVGTTGQGLALDDFRMYSDNGGNDLSGSVHWQLHTQTYGDIAQDLSKNSENTPNKRIEALRVWLDGDLAKYYDVVYKVHVQTQGWLDWAKNGEWAGSKKLCKRLEAVQIMIVPKGTTTSSGNVFVSSSTASNCAASNNTGSSSTGSSSTPTCSTYYKTYTQAGTAIQYCVQTLGGRCTVGTTSGGNCNCQYTKAVTTCK